ncbi:MAG: type II secretion system F family protein [Planctomycetota bacterium]
MPFTRLPLKTLTTFLHGFADAITAGLPVLRALRSMHDGTRNPRLRRALALAADSIAGGSNLADALALSNAFPDFVIMMISVSENSGTLDDTLLDLAEFYDWKRSVRRDIIRQCIYPALLLPIALVLMGVFLTVLDQTFQGTASHTYFSMVATVLVLAALVVFAFVLLRPQWRKALRNAPFLAAFGRALPIVGPLWSKLALANFAHALHLCIRAGVPIVEALYRAGDGASSITLDIAAHHAARVIREGSTLHEALERTRAFPRNFLEVVEIAEESGKLEDRLGRLARQMREEVRFAVAVAVKVGGVLLYLAVLLGIGLGIVLGYMKLFSNIYSLTP